MQKLTKQEAHELMIQHVPVSQPFCVMSTIMNTLSGKWKLLVLYNLSLGPLRYSALKQRLPECSDKMLTQTLKELMTDDLITKLRLPGQVSEAYGLSELAQSIAPALQHLEAWGRSYIAKRMAGKVPASA